MRKKSFLLLANLLFFTFIAVGQQLASNDALRGETSVTWEKKMYDFGNVRQNEPAVATFHFTNTSGNTLTISNVKGTCGCTVVEYSDKALAPGESGTITASYDARKEGAFKKSVKVYINQEETPVILYLKGTVLAGNK